MLFKRRKHLQREISRKTRVIEGINSDTRQKIDDATKTTEKLKQLLEKNGITLQIFIATGGDKRNGH